MRLIPNSPGILKPQHTNPILDPISQAHILAQKSLQVVLPTAANSNNSSRLFPAQQKRASSDSNASSLELGSQDVTISYKLTDVDPAEEEEDSPYAEVRASVSNIDDPDMPVLTFRMWVIGIFLNAGSAAVNTFLNFRDPQIYVISLPVLCVF